MIHHLLGRHVQPFDVLALLGGSRDGFVVLVAVAAVVVVAVVLDDVSNGLHFAVVVQMDFGTLFDAVHVIVLSDVDHLVLNQ